MLPQPADRPAANYGQPRGPRCAETCRSRTRCDGERRCVDGRRRGARGGAAGAGRGDRVVRGIRARVGPGGDGPTELGNHVGVMPVEVPATRHPLDRLARVSQSTRTHRQRRGRGASTALLGPAFRLLGALGVFRWFIDRQRLVTTFVTNFAVPPHRCRSSARGSSTCPRWP